MPSKIKIPAIFLIFLFSGAFTQAQIPRINKKPFPDSLLFTGLKTVNNLDEAMYDFRKKNDLAQYGGWKWYGRAIAEYAQRSNSNGLLPSAVEYLNLIKEASNKTLETRSNFAWFPLGPFNKPNGGGWLNRYGMARVNCIEFHPTNPAIWYAGFAQGGIWKTADTGKTWVEMNNGLPILRISDIAIDPNNTQTMYCCLGDFEYCEISLLSADRKRNTHYGLGIYKSTDGGNNWKPTGLSAAMTDFDGSLFRRVFVNPGNSQELLAAGISGVYKSKDGGANWTKVYSITASDMEINEKNPNEILVAGRWLEFSNTGSAKILKSYDFGNTWSVLNVPWPPTGKVTRVEIALTPADTNYIYAAAVAGNGGELEGFYLSKDGGKNWTKTYLHKNNLMSNTPEDSTTSGYSQGKYNLALCASRTDKNKVYLGGIQSLFSANGGKDFGYVYSDTNHVDNHQYKIHPKLNRWILCNDGGIYSLPVSPNVTSFDDARMRIFKTNSTVFYCNNMNIGSYYRIAVPYYDTGIYVSGAQDNGSIIGNNWSFVSGGDGMDCAVFSDEIITSSQYGSFYYFNHGSYDQNLFIANTYDGLGEWTTPICSVADKDTGAKQNTMSNVFLLYDELIDINGGFSPLSNIGNGRVGTAMDFSNADNGKLYCSFKPNNASGIKGRVFCWNMQLNKWQNITAGLPDSLYATDIALSNANDSEAYICFSGFTAGTKIFYTKNAGKTWLNISYNLPNIPVNALIIDDEDSLNTVYAGTDIGVYKRDKNANSWQSLSKNLPNVIVSDLKIQPQNRLLVASTFGRALWACQLPPARRSKTNAIKNLQFKPCNIYGNMNKELFIILPQQNAGFTYDIIDQTGRIIKQGNLLNAENKINLDANFGVYYVRVLFKNYVLQVEKIYLIAD